MSNIYREDWDIRSEEGSLCFASAIYSRLVGGDQDESALQWLAQYLRDNATPQPVPVADGEVAEVVAGLREIQDCFDIASGMEGCGPVVMRAALLPEPVAPTDEELTLVYAYAVAAAVDNKRGPFKPEDAEAAQLAGLRAVLARWGSVSTPLPRTQNGL